MTYKRCVSDGTYKTVHFPSERLGVNSRCEPSCEWSQCRLEHPCHGQLGAGAVVDPLVSQPLADVDHVFEISESRSSATSGTFVAGGDRGK